MTTKVDGHVDDIVKQFTTWLEEKGIVVYATVDHAKDMRDRGVEPPVTAWTVVFGNRLRSLLGQPWSPWQIRRIRAVSIPS